MTPIDTLAPSRRPKWDALLVVLTLLVFLEVWRVQGLVPGVRDIDDENPLVDVNLGSSQADTRGCIHGLEHIVDEPSELSVKLRHRTRARTQPLIGEFENRSDGHDPNFRYCS